METLGGKFRVKVQIKMSVCLYGLNGVFVRTAATKTAENFLPVDITQPASNRLVHILYLG